MIISTLFTRGLVAEVQQRGVALDDLMRGTGLSPEQLSDIHGRAPVEALTTLGLNALTLTGDPELGLNVALKAPINALQVLSHLMLSCRTLRHALEAFQRHAPYVAEGSAWEVYERQNLAYLYYERALANDDVARIVADGVIASMIRLGRFFVPTFRPEEIWFRHAAPSYAERYTQLFNCSVRFGRPRNAVICERELLDRPQLHADDTMIHVLHETASRLLRPSGEQRGLAEKVRVLLTNDSAIGTANIESLARRLGMSQRTLRRRLAEEGCRFTLLLDEVRCDLACAELHKGDGSIKSAAERVGFSERSSFHRAFKRWTGKTPLEYVHARPPAIAAGFA